jgi:hypothetical protein
MDIIDLSKTIVTEEEIRPYLKNPDFFDRIATQLVTIETNLYLEPDDENYDSDFDRVENIQKESIVEATNILQNLSGVFLKFVNHQHKSGNMPEQFYFKFYHPALYKDEIVFSREYITQAELRPAMNNCYILSLFCVRLLAGHYFKKFDDYSRVIEYFENELVKIKDKGDPPLAIKLIEKRIHDVKILKKIIEKEYRDIFERCAIFIIQFFINNISWLVNGDNNLEFIEKIPEKVLGILGQLVSLPRIDVLSELLEQNIINIYYCSKFPRHTRLDLFMSSIHQNHLGAKFLTTTNSIGYLDIIVDDICYCYHRGADYNSEIVCLSTVLSYFEQSYSVSEYEKSSWKVSMDKHRTAILAMLNLFGKTLENIKNRNIDSLASNGYFTPIVELRAIICLIKNRDEILDSHLVHYIPYMFSNLMNIREILNDKILELMRSILDYCATNSDTINYIANITDEKTLDMLDCVLPFTINKDKIKTRQVLFNRLVDADSEYKFVDPIQSSFILKIGYLPLTNGDKQLCDRYVIESALCNNPVNPFTREQLTIEEFRNYQEQMRLDIETTESDRRKFIVDNK